MNTQRLINPNDRTVTAIQSRHHTSLELIAEYAEQMDAGMQFDPCSAIETPEGEIYIWDGKHRLEAAIRNGSMLLVELEPGMKNEAYWKSCAANKKHGLKRSNADIQKAVQDALSLRPEKSDREIGLWVGCDHKTVGKYRRELAASGDIPQMQKRMVTRGDQEYQIEIPIKTEPIEKPDVDQPVRHLTGFIPSEVQTSTQKRLALKPNEDKPRMTIENLKPRIKMFLQGEFPDFTEAHDALKSLCDPILNDVSRPLMHRLIDFVHVQYGDSQGVCVRDGCKAALEDWNALADYREQMQAAREDAPPSDADVCPECLSEHGDHEPGCTYYEEKCAKCGVMLPEIEDIWTYEEKSYCWDCIKQFKPHLAEREAREETHNAYYAPDNEDKYECYCIICQSWQPRVFAQNGNPHRGVCRTCAQTALHELLDMTDPHAIAEVSAIEKEYEINVFKPYDEALAKIPGTPEFWFNKCELDAWQLFLRYSSYRKENGTLQTQLQHQTHKIENLTEENARLKEKLDQAATEYFKVRKREDDLKEQLLAEQQNITGEPDDDIDQHIKGIDRDKILRAGLRQIRVSVYQLVDGKQHISLKEYTPATNTTGRDDSVIIGSWKTLETFITKKALKDRIKELEQNEHVIISGRI